MSGTDWFLAGCTIGFLVDAYYTRKWLKASKEAVEATLRECELILAATASVREESANIRREIARLEE